MRPVFATFLSLLTVVGCSGDPTDSADEGGGGFSSQRATLLDFAFDAELLTVETQTPLDQENTIRNQLLYTIGGLNGDWSVGRLDALELSNIKKTPEGDKVKISYHAKLPVAWGSKQNLPTKYTLVLPRNVSSDGMSAFAAAYMRTCVDEHADHVDEGSYWYYFRPRRSGCKLKPSDVVEVSATTTPSTKNTTNKYPEYSELWADNRLDVVAIFGKYDANAATEDVGIDGFNAFVSMIRRELGVAGSVSVTPTVSDKPGPAVRDVTVEVKLNDGKVVKVTALLVDAITQVWDGFDARYESLTPTADVIVYNGHAGLGQNVRALARKGRWFAKKYQIMFMNGCDTFAYVDGSLAQLRARLNPDDPDGTKYMEFVTNAMPSFFTSMPNASNAFMKGLLSYQQPKTYDQIFAKIDASEVVLVTGEEDNVFRPGMSIGGDPNTGRGFPVEEASVVEREGEKHSSLSVPAGKYVVELSGDFDADLYVRKDSAPTEKDFDCRPFEPNSLETCKVEFSKPGNLHVMVRGNAPITNYKLTISKQ